MPRPWTRKEEETALTWSLLGEKPFAIARRLGTGRSWKAVAERIGELKRVRGLQGKPPPDRGRGELSLAVRRMCGPGISDGDVAKVLGVTRAVVTNTRRRCGIPSGCEPYKRKGGWKPGDPGGLWAAVVRLYGVWGVSDAEVARLTGEPRHRVTYCREKMGIPACGRAGRVARDGADRPTVTGGDHVGTER